MTPWLTWIGTKNVDEFILTKFPQGGWHSQPAMDTWGRKGWRTQGQCVLIPELLVTHGKFRTSVLCLLHMDTNLPSGFPTFSPSSLQSMWSVSKRVHLFKYCSAPLTYSKPPCGSPLPREARSPFCTCRRKQQPTPVFLPGESHGRKSLAGYGPWACKELDTTEHTHTHAHTHTCKGKYVAREFMQSNAGGSVRIMYRQQRLFLLSPRSMAEALSSYFL